jgi:hypothetical protein
MHTGSKMYFVLGIEPFGCAEVWGVHDNKQKATQQAQILEQNKPALCCQRYVSFTKTEIKRRKLELYA